MRFRQALCGAVFAALSSLARADDDFCENKLLSPTDNLIAYLDALVSEGILTGDRLDLLRGAALPDSAASSWLVHRDAIFTQLHHPNVEPSRIDAWIAGTAESLRSKSLMRESVQKETRSAFSAVRFVTVREAEASIPESFPLGDSHYGTGTSHKVEAFEITDTLINQGQWMHYMHANPAHFKAGTVQRSARGEHLLGEDQPLENASWWSVAEFANRVSVAHHLPPFYKFENLEWKQGTSAEMGDLEPVNASAAFAAWQNSHDPTRSDATGYRMPFAREWYRILVHAVAPMLKRPPEDIPMRDLKYFPFETLGWVAENSLGFPHSTTDEGKFIELDGQQIFGIVGNLWQRTSDLVTMSSLPMGQSIRDFENVGGAFDMSEVGAWLIGPSWWPNGMTTVGFRLARTLPPAEPTSQPDARTLTDNFIAYLDALCEGRILKVDDLRALQTGEWRFDPQHALSSSERIHREALQHHLQAGQLDGARVRAWAEEAMQRMALTQQARHETQAATRNSSEAMTWVHVPHRRVIVPSDLQRPVTFSGLETDVLDFEMSSKLVTQGQWIALMQSNPSHFKSGTANFDDEQPVDSINWWSAAEFADRLSIANGLPPFYNFQNLKPKAGTSAEAGTLEPESEREALLAWREVHRAGRTDATGYRLPRGSEWYRVLAEGVAPRLGKTIETVAWADLRAFPFEEIAWLANNSGDHPHSAAEDGKYVLVEGQRIYDVIGNLRTWLSDMGQPFANSDLGADSTLYPFYSVGGTYNTFPVFDFMGADASHRSMSAYGFRLVRSLPDGGPTP